MNTKLAAFIIAFVSFAAIVITIRNFRRDKLPTRIFFMWLAVWSGIGIIVLFPSLLDNIATFLNIGVRMNLILMSAILLLLIIVFYMSANITNLSRKVTKLTEEVTLLQYTLKRKKEDETSE